MKRKKTQYCINLGSATHRPMQTICFGDHREAAKLYRKAKREGTPAQALTVHGTGAIHRGIPGLRKGR